VGADLIETNTFKATWRKPTHDMADLAIEMNYESARRVLRATSSARQRSPVLLLARWA
jgi:methionine synthase I (cobalamin-dependent)